MDNEVNTYVRYQFNGFGQGLERTVLEKPTPKGDEVLVRVSHCGVCHTDLHLYDGYYALGQGKKLSLEDRGIKLPVTLGHEIVGVIESVGENVGDVPIGKPVLVYPWIGCGSCEVCKRGEENLCTKSSALGIFKPGGYSQYVVVPHSRYLVELGNLKPSHASLLACSGLTTFSAIKKIGKVHEEESVVVIGCGGLGLLAIRTLSLLGIKNIIALDLSEKKREVAKQVGATLALDPSREDLAEEILQKQGATCTAVLDFVGAESTTSTALSLLKKGGKLIVVGLHGGELRYPLPYLITKSISIIGSYTGTLPEQRELVEFASKHDLFSLPIKTKPLEQANEALKDLAEGKVDGRLVLEVA